MQLLIIPDGSLLNLMMSWQLIYSQFICFFVLFHHFVLVYLHFHVIVLLLLHVSCVVDINKRQATCTSGTIIDFIKYYIEY